MKLKLTDNPDFERWCYETKADGILIDGKPVPLITYVLYRIVDEDGDKFEETMAILQMAFEAGQKAPRGDED